MENLIHQLKKHNSDLSLGIIEGILYLLKNEKNLTNNSLITLTGLSKETLKRFKQSISHLLQEPEGEEIILNKDGENLLSELDLQPYKWSLKDSFIFFSEPDYTEKIREIENIKNKYSPKPKREYDQFLSTPETSYLKSRILIEKNFVKGKSIAFLGDDDLNSLSLATLNTGYKNITVFDIDDKLLDSIEKCSKERGLRNISVVKYDARKELEQQYFGKFDIVVFDPPYTKSGVSIFLQRAIDLLGSVNNFDEKYVVMYYGNSFKSPEKILKIQEIINRFGFSIEDRIEKFARYSGAESIGNSSSLYILRANKFTKQIGRNFENIYTFEKVSEEKFPFVDHVVFKVFDVKKDFLISKGRLMSALEDVCKSHRLKVIEKIVTEFKGGGMTISFILSNSNLTVHTWPEHGALHIDLITCSPIYNKEGLFDTLQRLFNTQKIEVFFIE
ncbi:bis-aminopropyl spermidine synthase family protein [Patescibacteria group bacterium]|nr:bis-aminopropyl spermidine synthase family protein [Patescibacteria group bacterium]